MPPTVTRDDPLTKLGLTEGPLHCLDRAGIRTVGQLLGRTSAELLQVTNFGEKSLQKVRRALWLQDLWLADGRWGDP